MRAELEKKCFKRRPTTRLAVAVVYERSWGVSQVVEVSATRDRRSPLPVEETQVAELSLRQANDGLLIGAGLLSQQGVTNLARLTQ